MRVNRLVFAAALALGLAACAGLPKPGPVAVTRFVEQDATARLAQGSFFVEAAPGTQTPAAQIAPYKAAVARELTALGYRETSREEAAIIAQVRTDSAISTPAMRRRGPVSVGVGGSSGGYYGSGVGVGLSINLGGGGPKDTRDTELGVMLRDAESGAAFWDARAQFSVDTRLPLAESSANAAAMADALFQDFPGNNGETITIKVSE